jgi:hypothetical protein
MTAWTFAPMAAPVVVTARATRTCGGASTSYRRAVPIRRRGQRGGAHGRLPAISRDELDAVLDDDDERIALEQTRRTFLASFAMLTTASSSGIALASPSIPARPSLPALSASLGDQLQSALAPATEPGRIADAIRLPMILDGGTYVVQYNIGDTPCRGVVDTGSPFLTMEGRCTNYWGCLKESDARPSGYDNTYEVYGLQDDGVTRWVLGDARFDGEVVDVSDEPPVGIYGVDGSVIDAQSSSSESKSGNKLAAKQRFSFPEVLFGVTSEVTAKEGSSASPAAASPFLGLVKERAEWYQNSENNKIQIRPTFLGQTDVTSFSLDFNTDTLVLSRREQIPRELTTGTMAMVDLRPLGSPVFHYAVPVEELWINGGEFILITVWAISCLTACFVHSQGDSRQTGQSTSCSTAARRV